jgi:16S rRNA (guanine527-N7)-methyltransferase
LEILIKYFPNLTKEQTDQFMELEILFREWNSKINLISRNDIGFLYEKHILHSLSIAKVIKFKSGTSILDVGTGGGFPGIPLAILFPDSKFHLVDSIGKKIMVVNDITQKLNLKNVKAEQIRVESIDEKYDFVVSRAVTRLNTFYHWVKNKFMKGGFNDLENGILYLKGGDLREEIKELRLKTKVYELSEYFEEEFFETKKLVHIPVR